MSSKSNSPSIGEIIKNHTIHNRTYTFYQVERLIRMAEKAEEYKPTCHTCSEKLKQCYDIAENLPDYIETNRQQKRKYEQIFDDLSKHLKIEHQHYPHNYFASGYTLIGMVSGLFSGLLFYFGFNTDFISTLIIGISAGLTIGWIAGFRKDNSIRNKGKML